MKSAFLALATLLMFAHAAAAEGIERIASAGGDITEILFELGLGEKVVAVDSTSIYPESVRDLPSVGYVRELSAEGVLATGADLLIGSHDMGPPAVMDNLAAAGMRVEFAPDSRGAERFVDKVAFVSGIVGEDARGEELIALYQEKIAELKVRKSKMERAPKALLILAVRDGAPIAAGIETTGNDMIVLAGGENVATYEGWKPMSAEAVIAAAPEIIFLSSAHIERMGGIDAVMELPSIKATPAGQNGSYLELNAQMMLQFGPRSPIAMGDMMSAFEAILAD
ncbi:MAG: ABC transporter substrate-binding protein [Pseudomonadota bacterium]